MVELRSELMSKLDMITRFLAHQVAQAHDTLEAKAGVLSSLDLKPKEIVAICGTTRETVSVRLAEAKRKETRKKGRQRNGERSE